VIRGTYHFAGFKKVANAIRTRIERFEKKKNYIFVEPLDGTIQKIKKELSKATDPLAHPRPNGDHVYKGYLYRSIKAGIIEDKGDQLTVQMGYYVPYGVNLEEGHPPFEPDARTIRQWVWKKYGPVVGWDTGTLLRISQGIIQGLRDYGQKDYPILVPKFFGNIRRYANSVMARFGQVFLK
jgi:hypothetical protein